MASIEQIMQVKSPYKSSPVKDASGPARTAFGHISSFLSLIEQWKKLQSKGLLVAQSIQALKLFEISGEEYPEQLTPLSESLVEAGKGMKTVIEEMLSISKQATALAKLYSSPEPMFNTWSASKISAEIENLCSMFVKETELKQNVIENICHSRDECLTEVHVSSWEYNVFVDSTSLSLLHAELRVEEEDSNTGKGLKSP